MIKDGRHYIDGGPKCEHEFISDSGTAKCFGGKIKFSPRWNPSKYGSTLGECQVCHGTGVLPVEEWSDAQLDEALNAAFDTWDLQMRREMHTNIPVYQIAGEPWRENYNCGDTSREAKIEAVIAVAESEGKE